MTEPKEEVVNEVSQVLRKWIHDVNNALFVTKGFMEEVQEDIGDRAYTKADYDHENLQDMIETITRNIDKIDKNLQDLRKYARHDIYKKHELEPPQ